MSSHEVLIDSLAHVRTALDALREQIQRETDQSLCDMMFKAVDRLRSADERLVVALFLERTREPEATTV